MGRFLSNYTHPPLWIQGWQKAPVDLFPPNDEIADRHARQSAGRMIQCASGSGGAGLARLRFSGQGPEVLRTDGRRNEQSHRVVQP